MLGMMKRGETFALKGSSRQWRAAGINCFVLDGQDKEEEAEMSLWWCAERLASNRSHIAIIVNFGTLAADLEARK